MRTITGRFITAHNGKPAAYGNLHLELDDEEDNIENVVPLGELAESLKIPLDEEYRKEWRDEERNRGGGRDEEMAQQEAMKFKDKYTRTHPYAINPDPHGLIP